MILRSGTHAMDRSHAAITRFAGWFSDFSAIDPIDRRLSFVNALFVTAILVVSVCNVTWALYQYAHWPVMVSGEWERLESDLTDAKAVLGTLPGRHIEYQIEDAPETYNQADYYRLQSILLPVILQHDPVKDGYVFVEFGK